jgi:hypothetical protein
MSVATGLDVLTADALRPSVFTAASVLILFLLTAAGASAQVEDTPIRTLAGSPVPGRPLT